MPYKTSVNIFWKISEDATDWDWQWASWSHSSYGEGDHCLLRLSGLPAAHTLFWVIPQSPHLISPFTQWFTIGPHRHLVGCPQARNVNHCIYSDSVLLHNRLQIRIQSKNLACGAICFISFACGAIFSSRNLACGAFIFIKICLIFMKPNVWWFLSKWGKKSTLDRPTVNQSIN